MLCKGLGSIIGGALVEARKLQGMAGPVYLWDLSRNVVLGCGAIVQCGVFLASFELP